MTSSTNHSADLSLRILRTPSAIRQIAADWRQLFCRCSSTAFQSPDWLIPWLDVFSPQNLMFAEVRHASRLIGLAPLLVYRRQNDRGVSERVLAFAGGGVSDYLDFLIEPGFEAAVVSRVFEEALQHDSWDVLELTDLPPHSALFSIPFFKEHAREHDACSVLKLPDTDAGLLQLFSRRQRANLRQARSRLARAGGGNFEIATPETAAEFLDELFSLHTDRWSARGENGVLHDPRVRDFHLSAAPGLSRAGLLHLCRLRVGGRTAAVIYSLLHSPTAFCYLQGFAPESAALSPGTQLMFFAIERARAAGIREFDFLRGQETYKRHWRPQPRPTYRIHLTRAQVSQFTLAETPARSRAA